MNLIKLAQLVEMSLDIPSSEKKVARKIVSLLKGVSNKINVINKHLDILYNPFKNNENVSSKSVKENRGTIRRYRDEIKKNFQELEKLSVFLIQEMNYFSTDAGIVELINAYKRSFGDFKETSDILLETLDDVKSEQFRDNVLTAFEAVLKQGAQLDKLIHDRIIEHINTNIIAGSWLDSATETYNISLQEHEPYIKKLYKEREDKLRQILESH